MSLSVSNNPTSPRPTIQPATVTDTFAQQSTASAVREPARSADGFIAPAPRKAVELGGAPLKGAPVLPSASLESLFAPKADVLSLASGAGAPTVPQVELDPGADGPDVRNLQECLVQLGYIGQDVVNSAPGHFGPNTEAAMRAFQADHGLEQVGRFGPGSRAAMNTAIGRMGQVDSIIDNAYRGLLGREADTGGRLSWRHGAEQMLAGGGSMDQVRGMIEGGIKSSPEYQNRQGGGQNPTQVVNDLYNQILERPGDPGGVQNWTNRYNQLKAQGMGAGDIRTTLANEMRAQPEYAVKEAVKDLYRNLLQREVDPVGRKNWTDYGLQRLGQGADLGTVRNEISSKIMQSEEYQKLHGGSTVPGAEQAIAYAFNPPPNPMNGGGTWHFWCLGLVNMAFQSAGRQIPELMAGSALESYQRFADEGRIRTDGVPPRGAVVYFNSFQNLGHVGISLGDGTIVNTMEEGPETGVRRISDLPGYLGWAIP